MIEPICIMFGGSQEYRDHIYQRVMNERSFGATAGDSFWMGYGTYDVVDKCLQFGDEERKSITCRGWREKIDKAKAGIAASNAEWAIRDAAEKITDDEFDVWLNTITKGQNEYANNNH